MPSVRGLSSSSGAKGKGNKETQGNVWDAGDVHYLGSTEGLVGTKTCQNALDMCSWLSIGFTPLELSKKIIKIKAKKPPK